MPEPTPEELVRGIVKAAIELACIRHNLCFEDESPMVVEECAELVEDTFNAMYGIDTCSEEPCEEVLALHRAMGAKV